MDLVNEKVGAEGEVKIVISGGAVAFVGGYMGKGGSAELKLSLSADYFMDQLAAAIPGTFDDAIIGMLKSAIKAL